MTYAKKLKTHLLQIRKRGYAISDQEVDHGVRAVAAPNIDGMGRLIGGLNVAGPIHRFNKKRFHPLSKFVVEYSKKISGIL